MIVHSDWATPGFDRDPAAVHLGPFPHRPFLERWWKARGSAAPMFLETDTALLPATEGPAGIEFLGEPDLTDYHAPLGRHVGELAGALREAFPAGTRFRFDSLPGEAADLLEAGLVGRGVGVVRRRHEIAAVVDLPADRASYLQGLRSKDRHELRRKLRRFEERFGAPRIERDTSPESLATFVSMHRAAPGEKGTFMTAELEGFFASLLDLDGVALDLLLTEPGDAVAVAFGFEDPDAYYLYNSAYHPAAAEASPGVVLLDRLLDRTMAAGRTRFDLLKGDERYKFQLGAIPRPLFVLEGVL